jgi:hypothetical protein
MKQRHLLVSCVDFPVPDRRNSGSTIEKLQEIKQTQLLMQNQQEWSQLNEEDRNRMTEIYQNNEREVKGKADLAMETVNQN